MKTRIFFVVSCTLVTTSCLKTVPTHQVIQIQAKNIQLLADGQSRDTIYAYFPYDATPDKRFATFQAATGLFDNGKDTLTVSANRTDIMVNKWTAVAYLTSSLRAGPDTLVARINFSPLYSDSTIVTLTPSIADSIALSASAFAVKVNFGSDITLTGRLFNSSGHPVSLGTRVKFSDFYDGGGPVSGSYRQLQDSSDANSQVSVIYSPGLATPNSFIFVKAVILDNSGAATIHADSVKVYITP